jgi:hypothetical protein
MTSTCCLIILIRSAKQFAALAVKNGHGEVLCRRRKSSCHKRLDKNCYSMVKGRLTRFVISQDCPFLPRCAFRRQRQPSDEVSLHSVSCELSSR